MNNAKNVKYDNVKEDMGEYDRESKESNNNQIISSKKKIPFPTFTIFLAQGILVLFTSLFFGGLFVPPNTGLLGIMVGFLIIISTLPLLFLAYSTHGLKKIIIYAIIFSFLAIFSYEEPQFRKMEDYSFLASILFIILLSELFVQTFRIAKKRKLSSEPKPKSKLYSSSNRIIKIVFLTIIGFFVFAFLRVAIVGWVKLFFKTF